MNLQSTNELNGYWTNEKHVNFLNWMEASFVRRMLENDDRPMLSCASPRRLPLDRYLPDSAESTVDLKTRRSRAKATQACFSDFSKRGVRANDKTNRHSTTPYDRSQDQVVPQLGERARDKDRRGT